MKSILYISILVSFWSVAQAKKFQKLPPPNQGFVQEIDKLTKDQKYKAALKITDKYLEEMKRAKNDFEYARALIKKVQLQMGLHGYETAVKNLKIAARPVDPMAKTLVHLYYGYALSTYYNSYSWEINQREEIVSTKEVDLKKWTKDQISAQINKSFALAWINRQQIQHLPTSDFTEFVTVNTYPKGIRPTMRDAITYMWTQHLNNSSFWSPKESNSVYFNDLQDLLVKNQRLTQKQLNSTELHPLQKVSFLLKDLESWQKNMDRPEASLEAKLERGRLLKVHFRNKSSKDILVSYFKNTVNSGPKLPWLAKGYADWSEAVRASNTPASLIKAREIALKGQKSFPDSTGALYCKSIIASIEAPSFNLSGMLVDNKNKASLMIRHKNLNRLYFRAYKVNLRKELTNGRDYYLFPNNDRLGKILSRNPSHSWTVELQRTSDYREHKKYIAPELASNGYYVIVASVKPDPTDKKHNAISVTNFVQSNLILIRSKLEKGGWRYKVVIGNNGQTVQGARVELYSQDYQKGHRKLVTITSNNQGEVTFARAKIKKGHHSHFVIAQKGKDITIDASGINFYPSRYNFKNQHLMLFTDRSVYRPGQKIYFKALGFSGQQEKGQFSTRSSRNTKFRVSLHDANGKEIIHFEKKPNKYGSISGEFIIPPSRILGRWYLAVSGNGGHGKNYIQVEEYKRPTFEVTMTKPDKPLRFNDRARIKGEVKYYFGLPVTVGQVKWKVQKQPQFPWWWSWYYWGSSRNNQSQIVEAGIGKLNQNGEFHVEFTPKIAKSNDSPHVTYNYTVSVDVTDLGGETRSAKGSYQVGRVAVRANISQVDSFIKAKQKISFAIHRSSLNGQPLAGSGQWKLYSIVQPSKTRPISEELMSLAPYTKEEEDYSHKDDRRRPRWMSFQSWQSIVFHWPIGKELRSGQLKHDKQGLGKFSITSLQSGFYRLAYETKDSFGNKFKANHNFFVAGTNLNFPLIVSPDKTTYEPGSLLRLFVHSGFMGQPLHYEIKRGQQVLKRGTHFIQKQGSYIKVPIKESHRGGLAFSISTVNDHQFSQINGGVHVPWSNKKLNLEFSSFRDKLRPGTRERFSILIRGPDNKSPLRQSAEVLTYMYDRSLDAFLGHSPPSPLSAFPSFTYYRHGPTSNIVQAPKNHLYGYHWYSMPSSPYLRHDSFKFYNNYGIGGVGLRKRGFGTVAASLAESDVMKDGNVPVRRLGKRAKIKAQKADRKEANPLSPLKQVEKPNDAKSQDDKVRENFSETAFWIPHSVTNKKGEVKLDFDVPDSVTDWNVWVHAVTQNLMSGSKKKTTRTVKELMVRPYLPRFLREADKGQVKIIVTNASKKTMKVALEAEIFDPENKKNLMNEFGFKKKKWKSSVKVLAGGNQSVTLPVTVPSRIGEVAFKVVGRSRHWSDGEQRKIPLLPSRIHLLQSKFVALKKGKVRNIDFSEMKDQNDNSLIHQKLVVTLDAQLFYSVLSALPYLVNYPYQCTEQTLNRFVSTAILTEMFKKHPSMAKMAKKFAKKRSRQFEVWNKNDPNRLLFMEETPWMTQSEGGAHLESELQKVLEPQIAQNTKTTALERLQKSQTSLGGFPWFPGGKSSPYMTLLVIHGFSKAIEFGVDLPKPMVKKAWNYIYRHFKQFDNHHHGLHFLVYTNYLASSFPDDSWTGNYFTQSERKKILDYTFRKWRALNPYLKAYLSLTLNRMKRSEDANLVFASIMDSAETKEDQGTFWAAEDRSWLWYNDTIESHAYVLRAMTELKPKDPRREGLVQWLFLNKKLNHWKSTRTTAEVLYALAHYLETENQLGIKEQIKVKLGNTRKVFNFPPKTYEGKSRQWVIPSHKIEPTKMSKIRLEKTDPALGFASVTWQFSTEKLPTKDKGDFLGVSRKYYIRSTQGDKVVLRPIADRTKIHVGDEVEVHLSIRAKHQFEYVHLRDPRPAGLEPGVITSGWKWDLGLSRYQEIRDSATNFFFEWLPQGEYTMKYRVKAAMAGTFRAGPARMQSMYAPEFGAYSRGHVLNIK